jgi:hypothetical protein
VRARGRVPGRRALLALCAAAVITFVALACNPSSYASPTPPATATAGPAGTPVPLASFGPLTIDPALLGVLPASVAGLPVMESPEGDADARTNRVLPSIAEAAVSGVAVDTASGDLVVALVVRLRAGTFDDAAFRSWRDSYDLGACAASGGVTGDAEAQIGGRTVFVGTCANGLHTYHAWIADKNLLVSASSIGSRRLGEDLMANLRP